MRAPTSTWLPPSPLIFHYFILHRFFFLCLLHTSHITHPSLPFLFSFKTFKLSPTCSSPVATHKPKDSLQLMHYGERRDKWKQYVPCGWAEHSLLWSFEKTQSSVKLKHSKTKNPHPQSSHRCPLSLVSKSCHLRHSTGRILVHCSGGPKASLGLQWWNRRKTDPLWGRESSSL